jgi:uncharacterized repeat protein (TIGR01451 family)
MALPCRRWLLALATLVAATGPARAQSAAPLEVVQHLAENIAPGLPVAVEITLRNVSTLPVDGVRLVDDLPAGYDVRGAVPVPERAGDRLTWSVGRLAPAEERRFQLTLEARPGAASRTLRNAVDATYTGHVGGVRVALVGGAELVLEVHAAGSVGVGSPTTLWVTLRNRGDVAARNVSLQAVLPAGLSHPQGSDLESPLGTLEPGAERTLPLSVTAARAGEFRARLAAQADGAARVTREVTVRAEEAKLAVTPGGPTLLPQRLTGLFELTVRNEGAGSCPASVCVSLPEGMEFARASDGGKYDRQTHSVRWDLGELQPAGRRVVAWNGVPRQAGEMVCRVRVLCHDAVYQESSWTVRVVAGGEGPAE